tara:strand:- start:12297 stop:12959 length:663 start_codon:yes stop_codon:yes gene_type:complete
MMFEPKIGQPQSCEFQCDCCSEQHDDCNLVVLTGGPGAGKTAVLEAARKVLCTHVALLPEAASIVFGGGFWRLDSKSAKTAAQRVIFHTQREMENLVVGEKKWGVGLCDRGTLDGLAYWSDTEECFWKAFGTDKDLEYSKYKAVIHLRSPGVDKGYNYQNPIRTESAEEAAIIDERIHSVWMDHPNYFMIGSTDTFLEKVNQAFLQIKKFIPKCCTAHFE